MMSKLGSLVCTSLTLLAIALMIPCGLVSPAAATTWDLTTGYSATANPSGPWSWGRTWTVGGSSFDLFTVQWGPNGWYLGNWGHGGPSIQGPAGGGLGITNGPSIWAKNNSNGLPDVRWTSPAAGTYALAAEFIGADYRGVDNLVHILVNGVVVFSDHLVGYNDTTTFTASHLLLNQGDRIDLVAMWNGGVYSEYGWTGVRVTVTSDPAQAAVPEPATWGLVLLGGAALALVARRRAPSARGPAAR